MVEADTTATGARGDAGPVVRLQDVSFAYGEGESVLQGLSLVLEAGQFVAVFGANGAGKSTLCYLLSGVVPHIYGGERQGVVEVDGIDPWDKPMWETGRHVAIVLQDPESQLSMPDVGLELALGPSNFGVPAAEIHRRIEHALPIVRLDGLERNPVQALSGGQKQRVALGSAIVMQPRLLLLDEPTSQLDPLGHREVLEALSSLQLQETGQAVLMTTHNWDVQELADLVLVLDRGRPIAFGPTGEVLAQTALLERVGVQPPPLQRFYDFLGSISHGDAEGAHNGVDAVQGSERAAPRRRLVTPEEVESEAERLLETGAIRVKSANPDEIRAGGNGTAAVDGRATGSVEDGAHGGATGSAPLLELHDVTFAYPGAPQPAVSGVSLSIHAGECVGIVGQNGSGKSTLVKLIVGLLKAQSGSMRFHGEDLAKLRVAQIAQRIGLVLQNPDYQLFNISTLEEVRFGLENLKLPEVEVERRAKDALALVGLEGFEELFPFRLSFGDRRRLAVAAVLAMEPEVLILDEPTTAQDFRGRYLLADLAEDLRKRGKAIIMISHDMELVAHYASKVVVLWDGHVLMAGRPHEVFAQTDKLEQTKLRAPQVVPIVQHLGHLGVPADVVSLERLFQTLVPASA